MLGVALVMASKVPAIMLNPSCEKLWSLGDPRICSTMAKAFSRFNWDMQTGLLDHIDHKTAVFYYMLWLGEFLWVA